MAASSADLSDRRLAFSEHRAALFSEEPQNCAGRRRRERAGSTNLLGSRQAIVRALLIGQFYFEKAGPWLRPDEPALRRRKVFPERRAGHCRRLFRPAQYLCRQQMG